jgi:hypothetical protein
MIKINLLPDEYRQKARTPVKMLLTILAVVAINASLSAWWAWKAIGEAAEVESELAVLQDTMGSLQPQVDYHHSLEKENRAYESREQTLAGITGNRISWTRKVDQLIDLVNEGGDDEQYLVWLDDLTVTQSTDPRKKTFGSLKAGGYSGSGNFANVASFLEDVEESPFCSDFTPPKPPEGSQSQVDEELIPSVVVSFPLELGLLSPDDRAQARIALAGAEEAAAAEAGTKATGDDSEEASR